MRLRKRLATAVLALLVAGTMVGCRESAETRRFEVGTIAAPHSVYVDSPVPGMLPGYLCAFPLKSSDCPEDTIGWAGSSEDGRVSQ